MSRRARAKAALVALALALVSGSASADTDDDCIAASERAVSLRRAGSLLRAREELSSCSALACATALRTSCEKRLAELNAQVPTMVFHATDAHGADTTAVHLFIDGKAVAESLTGQAIAVDPGSHTFRFELQADGGAGVQTIEKQWVVQEGEKGRTESVSFAPPRVETPPDTGAKAPSPVADVHWSTRKKAGLVMGGVGIVGVGVGAVFGAMAISQWNGAKAKCTSSGTCGAGSAAQSDHDAAATSATVSTVSFIAGGALFAGGATLFFWPSSPDGASRGAAFGLRGSF